MHSTARPRQRSGGSTSASGLAGAATLERAHGSLVQLHGGTLTAQSDGEGKGCTFEVRIPLAAGRPAHRVAGRATKTVSIGAKIVVVEDNVDAREMLCHLLARAGFECRAEGDGLAALDLLAEFHPQAAVIDVGLPGLDGFEVARRVRLDHELDDVRLIAVTGYGQKADREMALDVGFDDHLVKPVRLEQLARVLKRRDTLVPDDPAEPEAAADEALS